MKPTVFVEPETLADSNEKRRSCLLEKGNPELLVSGQSDDLTFHVESLEFQRLLGRTPTIQSLYAKEWSFCHEAGIYDRTTNSVYFTSNYQDSSVPVRLYRVHVDTLQLSHFPCMEREDRAYDSLSNLNVGCQWGDCLLLCAQGSKDTKSALVRVDTTTWQTTVVIDSFRDSERGEGDMKVQGLSTPTRQFNSINDVVVHHGDGSIWFTDPTYGYAQGFKEAPELPNRLYRIDPSADPTSTSYCQVMDSGDVRFDMPNGLCFSPDWRTLYVTDTGAVNRSEEPGSGGSFAWYGDRARDIYTFSVVGHGAETKLENGRVLVRVDSGVPDGIKVDRHGNIWTGCGDGIHCYSPLDGSLLGKVLVRGGIANFCFAKGRIWAFNERRLILIDIDSKGCLEDIECL